MQFSQVGERGERQDGNQRHIILSRDNGITKFRFSLCSLLTIFAHMLRHTSSPQLKMTGVVAQAALKLVSGIRLMARFASCYVQTRRERNELLRLSHRSLRDIGLTTHDVEQILRRPILHRCWRSVNLCEIERCQNSIICMADCRVTPHLFH
jgi:uncharacterized protein YjiS (DUF1127 family)